MASSTGQRSVTDILFVLILVLFSASLCQPISLRSISSEGPPYRPARFNNVEELNRYLADLNEYYTVLGRPRFGKRGDSSHSLIPVMDPVSSSEALSGIGDAVEKGVQFAVAAPSLSYRLVHPSQRRYRPNVASNYRRVSQASQYVGPAPDAPFNSMWYMNYPVRFRPEQPRDRMRHESVDRMRHESRDRMRAEEAARYGAEEEEELDNESDD